MVLKHPQGHVDSEYGISFEIGQREGGFYSAQADRHTDRHTLPHSDTYFMLSFVLYTFFSPSQYRQRIKRTELRPFDTPLMSVMCNPK